MNKKLILIVAMIMGLAVSAQAGDNGMWDYKVGAGFNIGAMAPMGLPAEIRKIDSYSPTMNLSVKFYATRMLSAKWGLQSGVIFDNKGMKTGIEVKDYHLTMNVVSGEALGTRTGYYTGRIKNETKLSYITIPVCAAFRPNDKWEFSGGPYVAFAINRSFIGNVSEGKMREDPLHPAIGINHAEYNYSDDLRKFDTGLTLGCSRRVYRALSVTGNLQWGFLSVLNPSTRKIDMNTYNIYLNIGVTYKL